MEVSYVLERRDQGSWKTPRNLGQALTCLQVGTNFRRGQRRKLAPKILVVLWGPPSCWPHSRAQASQPSLCSDSCHPFCLGYSCISSLASRAAGTPGGICGKAVGFLVISLMSTQHLHQCHIPWLSPAIAGHT